jgi:cell division septation protein DedD
MRLGKGTAMIGKQQGGIISKILLIPAGLVVIIGAFALGYYAGKKQTEGPAVGERRPSLPEVVSDFLPKKEDLTFYRTLTEKGERTVSIDLPPRQQQHAPLPPVKEPAPAPAAGSGGGAKAAEPAHAGKPEQTQKPQPQKAPPPAAKKEQPAAKSAGTGARYTIQTGAYADRTIADEEVRNLKRRGYAAFRVSANIPDKGTWYRVRIGSFASKESAERLANDLRTKEGIPSIVSTE